MTQKTELWTFFFTDSTKVEYVLQHHSSFTNNEIQKLLKILKSFTGAKDDDILVSAVKEGCIHVTLMIRNHLIPILRSLYSPKNLRETCQRMSKSLQHRIIKVLIEDVPVYTGTFEVKMYFFLQIWWWYHKIVSVLGKTIISVMGMI